MLLRPRFWDWLRIRRLYRTAFPAQERKPFWMIRCMARRGVTDVWCLRHEDRFAGLAITINSPQVVLLDYFAICPDLRGRGVGTAALQALDACYSPRGFYVEIESTLIPSRERELRLRRKRFYLAAGLQEMHTRAMLFGVEMELLGKRCHLDFQQYHAFYRDYYSQWAADHVTSVEGGHYERN